MAAERPSRTAFDPEQYDTDTTLFDAFRAARTKIAIQKDGELTDISRTILADVYGIVVPGRDPKDRRLVAVAGDGEYGIVYARNKSICDLVAKGAVDMAVVGTDRLIEDGHEHDVDIVASYRQMHAWPLVLATPVESCIQTVEQVRTVATQYPIITSRYFGSLGLHDVCIASTSGGTEIYPYLDYQGNVDAVVDMSVTGSSLRVHNLVPWSPSIAEVYPVLIASVD